MLLFFLIFSSLFWVLLNGQVGLRWRGQGLCAGAELSYWGRMSWFHLWRLYCRLMWIYVLQLWQDGHRSPEGCFPPLRSVQLARWPCLVSQNSTFMELSQHILLLTSLLWKKPTGRSSDWYCQANVWITSALEATPQTLLEKPAETSTKTQHILVFPAGEVT